MFTIDDRLNLILTIGVKDLSEIVAWMIQSGIHFTIYPASGSVKEREETDREGMKPMDQGVPEEERIFLETIDRMIGNCLQTGTTPTLQEAANAFSMKSSSINRRMQKQQGVTFYQYCLEKKMHYAAELLRMGYNATSTSQKLGYIHPIKFNLMFQKQFGMTPHQYRKKHECSSAS